MAGPMAVLQQSPTDPEFVQNPYPFYESARRQGKIVYWQDYGMPCALSHAAVSQILRDRRFGRVPVAPQPQPAHMPAFRQLDDHAMIEIDGARHDWLRAMVQRAFTPDRIRSMQPVIARCARDLLDGLSARGDGTADLVPAFTSRLPLMVVVRMLGLPDDRSDDLVRWSSAMVAIYQSGRDRGVEDRAEAAASDFALMMREMIDRRRARPGDDLVSALLGVADAEGRKLSDQELVANVVLMFNAAREATVHALGNAIKTSLESPAPAEAFGPDRIGATVEECLRFDPPLHLFVRHLQDDAEVLGHRLARGSRIACLLAAANRDPAYWDEPGTFDTDRLPRTNLTFGAGGHFCLGAQLARLELQIALTVLFADRPGLRLAGTPRYADIFHFHGLESLPVAFGPLSRRN